MRKEELISWGLTDEQAGKVMDGLNGDFVTKARFNEVNTELAAAKKTVAERDKQLEDLKKSAGDAETLQKQIAQLQADNSAQKKAHEAEMKQLKISNAVDLALTSAKARNNTAARALLADFISKAELAEDGTVKGLADAVKKLSTDKETAFLFESSKPVIRGAKPAESGDGGAAGGMTLSSLRKLSPSERYNFSQEHPDEYRSLYGGNE